MGAWPHLKSLAGGGGLLGCFQARFKPYTPVPMALNRVGPKLILGPRILLFWRRGGKDSGCMAEPKTGFDQNWCPAVTPRKYSEA